LEGGKGFCETLKRAQERGKVALTRNVLGGVPPKRKNHQYAAQSFNGDGAVVTSGAKGEKEKKA